MRSGRRDWASIVPVAAATLAVGLGIVLPTITSSFPLRDLSLFLLAATVTALASARPSLSIVAVVTTFVFSAWVRRVLPAIDPSTDLSAITPFIVALPLALQGVKASKPVGITLLVTWVTLRALISFDVPLVGLAGWLNLAVPLLAAVGIAHVPSGLSTFARAVVICGSVAATYGIVQYFVPFSWDVEWLLRSGLESAGQAGRVDFRPFATLPAPGTGAVVGAVVILIVVFRSDLLSPSRLVWAWALGSAGIFVLLTQVRSVWLALLAALIVGSFAARGRPARQLLPLGAFMVAAVLILPPGEIIVDRIETLNNLNDDVSYQARLDLLSQTGALISPLGSGVGTLSAGSRVRNDASIDNGYLIILGELGVLGAILLVTVLVPLTRRSRPSEWPFLIFLLLTSASGFTFGNFAGLLLWSLAGLGRPDGVEDGETTAEAGAPPTTSRAKLEDRLGLPTGS